MIVEHMRSMIHQRSFPNYLLRHDPERKKEADDGGKIMREPALYLSCRTGKRILFV
jgi:hypothetical protein